ncbi:DUF732 domain-containing protein, partial [Embleya sp. NPDC056538]
AVGLSGGDDDKKSTASSTSSATTTGAPKSGSPTPTGKATKRTVAPDPTSDDDSTTGPGTRGLGEDNFLTTMHRLIPGTKSTPDADLISQGKQACSDLKSGKTLLDTAMKVTAVSGVSEKGMLVGGAIAAFCPEQSGKVS